MGIVTPFDRAIVNFKCALSQERLRHTPEEELALAKTKLPRNSTVYLSAVYVIGNSANNLLKIGYADHLKTRICGLNTGSPVDLQLLHFLYFVDGGLSKNIEGDAHKALAEFRRRGEWFEVPLEVAADAIATAVMQRKYRWWTEEERIRLCGFIKKSYAHHEERARFFGT